MSRRTYTAVATRAGQWWAIHVHELPGVFSQARRLEQIEGMTRDAVALMLDVAPDSFDVAVDAHLPDGFDDEVREVRRRREEAEAMAADAADARRVAAGLAAAGLPLCDIGAALGVSHQRVAQLLDQPQTSPARRPRKAAGRSRHPVSGRS